MPNEPLILGIDAVPSGGASLLRGSEVVVAIREERLSRVEGDAIRASLPFLALGYCREAAGVDVRDIDLVVCRSPDAADRWPDDITLNPQLQIPRNELAWMTISSDREPEGSASDAGVSAALRGLERRFERRRTESWAGRARGRSYTADEACAAIESVPAAMRRVPVDSVVRAVADRLCAGRTAGWFQGPSACEGDGRAGRMLLHGWCRASGRERARARVALADGETIPFDLAMTADDVARWCEPSVDDDGPGEPRLRRLSSAGRRALPPALHGPRSCSVFAVQPTDTRLHRLLEQIGRRTGQPFVCCAPFRAAGEPVVESPADALWTALQLGLDVCALDDSIVEPDAPSVSLLDLVPTIIDAECVISADCRQGSVDETMTTKRVTAEVMTPWGTTTRAINPLQLAALIEVDGRSSGWRLLKRINHDGRARMTAAWLLRVLAELRRLGIIALDAAPGGAVGLR